MSRILVFSTIAALTGLLSCKQAYENPDFLGYVVEHRVFIQDSMEWTYPPKELYEIPPFKVAGNTRIICLDTTTESNFLMINPYELYASTDTLDDTLHIGPIGFNQWRGHWRAVPDGIEVRFAATYRTIPRGKIKSDSVIEWEQLPGKDTTVTATIEKMEGGDIALRMLGLRFISHDHWTTRSQSFLGTRRVKSVLD